jgi:hypothetical protein
MNKAQMTGLLTTIAERQMGNHDFGNSTAPVTLSVGYINNICLSDGIVITDAPPAIINEVMEWVDRQNKENDIKVGASAGFGGLLIR